MIHTLKIFFNWLAVQTEINDDSLTVFFKCMISLFYLKFHSIKLNESKIEMFYTKKL